MTGPGLRSSASSLRALAPLLLLVLAFAVFPATAAAYIYFPNGPYIGRAHNDGTGLEPKFITTPGFNCGIAVDGGHIYWGSLGKGIARANLDGSGVDEEFIALSAPATPCGVAVDSQHVFWTNREAGFVGIADIDGKNASPALVSVEEPCGIAVDNGQVYFGWKNGGEFKLSSFSLPYGGLGPPLATTTGNCGVAVDSQNVYWANGGPASTTGFTVELANRDPFGAPQTLVVTEGGTKKPWSVAKHGEYVYYSAYGGPIGRVRADGSAAPEPNFLPLGGVVETVGIAVDDLPAPPAPPTPTGPGGGSPATPAKARIVIRKVKANARNGTAKVTVGVSAPGVVKLAGKKVKPAKTTAKRAGKVSLTVRAKKAAAAALRKAGHLRVAFTVSLKVPGVDPVSAKRSVTLVLAGR